MLTDHFPLLGLRLTTPRLQLRLPDPEELAQLADLAAAGVHDPHLMPFTVPWTDQPPARRARSVVQYHWSLLGAIDPDRWTVPFAVFVDGRPAGVQDIGAAQFAVLREVHTGSWLGREFHGGGIGTEMRAAVLQLAFAGLGALYAMSAAFEYNAASLGVSRKLGYVPDGVERRVVRGAVAACHRLRLARQAWEAQARVPVTVEGLDPCLALLGAGLTGRGYGPPATGSGTAW